MKILLTSGGTKIPIDMVRSISNMSRGTFGSAICKEFLLRGHEVDFLMADGSRTPFKYECSLKWEEVFEPVKCAHNEWFDNWLGFVYKYGQKYHEYTYKTFEEYHTKIINLLKENEYDMVILSAAVSDYGVKNYVDGKIRSSDALNIELYPLPKIISNIKELQPNTFLVGFKLLVGSTKEQLVKAASDSLEKNGCGIVVANDLEDIKCDNHTLMVVEKDTVTIFEKNVCENSNTILPRELVNHIMVSYVTTKDGSSV